MKQKISFFVIFLVACFLVSDLEAQRGRAFSQPSQNQLNNFLNPAAGRCGGLVRLSPPDN